MSSLAARLVVCLVATVAPWRVALTQSTGDLSAFSALIVSPVGALPPLAFDAGRPQPERASVSLRYGGWRYDIDDEVHNNIGLTLTHRLGASSTSVSVTGLYVSRGCACSVWASGGVSLTSTLWTSARAATSHPGIAAHAALAVMTGGARFSGEGHAVALSAASALDLGVGVPFIAGSRLSASILPGIGMGRLTSVDETGGGRRPLLGAGASWMFARGVAIDVGMQRVVLPGGPTQGGAGMSWHAW